MSEPVSRDFAERVKVVRYLIDRFPRQEVSSATIRAYAFDLLDLDERDLWLAAKLIAHRADFFPSLAEIFKAAADVRDEREGVPSADEAWAWATELIPEGGPGLGCVPPRLELAAAAIRAIGGWEQLGLGQVADRPWRRKEFVSAYSALLERRRTGLTGALDEPDPQRFIGRTGSMTRLDANAFIGKIAHARQE